MRKKILFIILILFIIFLAGCELIPKYPPEKEIKPIEKVLDDGSILKKIDNKTMQIFKDNLNINITSSKDIIEIGDITKTKEWGYDGAGNENITVNNAYIEDLTIKSNNWCHKKGKEVICTALKYKPSIVCKNITICDSIGINESWHDECRVEKQCDNTLLFKVEKNKVITSWKGILDPVMITYINTSWGKRKRVNITGTSSDQTNYTVLFNVFYGSGSDSGNNIYLNSNSKIDFSDIRFTNISGTILDYWIQNYTDSVSATIYVKIDDLPTNGTSIFIYYNNSVASSKSNGTNTFLFFDDFNDNLLSSQWGTNTVVSGSSISEESQKLKITRRAYAYPLINFTEPVSMEFKWNITSIDRWTQIGTVNYDGTAGSTSNSPNNAIYSEIDANKAYNVFRNINGTRTQVVSATIFSYSASVWYLYRVIAGQTTYNYLIYRDGALLKNYSNNEDYCANRPCYISPAQGWESGTPPLIYIDDFRVRKYDLPEPTFIIGSEENITTGDTCDCPVSGNWKMQCNDACAITSNCSVGGFINITDENGAGTVTFNATYNVTTEYLSPTCIRKILDKGRREIRGN